MDEVLLEGQLYISAKRAAREQGYASDYIGQLIRSGKLVGRKVGRAWYVEQRSLQQFLGIAPATVAGHVSQQGMPVAAREEAAVAELKDEVVPQKVQVKKVPNPHTAAAIQTSKPMFPREELPLLTYLADSEPTLPTLLREREVRENKTEEEGEGRASVVHLRRERTATPSIPVPTKPVRVEQKVVPTDAKQARSEKGRNLSFRLPKQSLLPATAGGIALSGVVALLLLVGSLLTLSYRTSVISGSDATEEGLSFNFGVQPSDLISSVFSAKRDYTPH